jgi:hypothetical protein
LLWFGDNTATPNGPCLVVCAEECAHTRAVAVAFAVEVKSNLITLGGHGCDAKSIPTERSVITGDIPNPHTKGIERGCLVRSLKVNK